MCKCPGSDGTHDGTVNSADYGIAGYRTCSARATDKLVIGKTGNSAKDDSDNYFDHIFSPGNSLKKKPVVFIHMYMRINEC